MCIYELCDVLYSYSYVWLTCLCKSYICELSLYCMYHCLRSVCVCVCLYTFISIRVAILSRMQLLAHHCVEHTPHP